MSVAPVLAMGSFFLSAMLTWGGLGLLLGQRAGRSVPGLVLGLGAAYRVGVSVGASGML